MRLLFVMSVSVCLSERRMIVWLVLWAGCLVVWEIVSTFALANEQECFVFPSADAQDKVVGDFLRDFVGKETFCTFAEPTPKSWRYRGGHRHNEQGHRAVF